MVIFDTPEPIFSFKGHSGPTGPVGWAWVSPTDPITHEIMFSYLQKIAYDQKLGLQP